MGGWGANPPTLFPPFPFAIYDYGIIIIADIPKYSHRTCNRPKCVFPVRHNSELSTTSTLVRSVYHVAKYFVSGPGTKGCPPVIELIPKYHAPPAPLLRAPAEALPRPCLLLRPPRRPPHVTVPRHAGRRSEKLPRTHQGLTQSEKKRNLFLLLQSSASTPPTAPAALPTEGTTGRTPAGEGSPPPPPPSSSHTGFRQISKENSIQDLTKKMAGIGRTT